MGNIIDTDLLDVFKYNRDNIESLCMQADAVMQRNIEQKVRNEEFLKGVDENLLELKAFAASMGVDIASIDQQAKTDADDFMRERRHGIVPFFDTSTDELTYEELVALAHSRGIENTQFCDLLSEDEEQEAFARYDELDRQFSIKTSIFNKTDLTFLAVATALQVVRWVVAPELGDKIDKSTRQDDKAGEASVKENKEKFQEKHKKKEDGTGGNWESKGSDKYKSWEEILYSKVPYDATRGASKFGVNMGGGYHRYKTPGHDPMLGWFFGTVNILTSTITINNMRTFDVEKGEFFSETTLINAFMNAYYSLQEDKHRLPAAVFRQFLHYKSDAFTKNGLPVPLIGVFSEKLAGNLYKSQYDLLCLAKDAKKIAMSAGISIIIDMIVTIFHGLFYDENTGLTRDEYEVKTRKILLISHMIASSSNIIYCAITKNPKKLDIGGLLVTVARLFGDIRFIRKIKKEFIQTEIDKSLQAELDKLDFLMEANKNHFNHGTTPNITKK